MKAFIFSLIIIGLLCALTVVNALIIGNRLGDISDELAALPEKPGGGTSKIAREWKKFRPLLGITVRESVLSSTDSLFRRLEFAARFGNAEAYASSKAALLDMLDGIKCADIPYFFDSVIT